jgi:hypothetical protein
MTIFSDLQDNFCNNSGRESGSVIESISARAFLGMSLAALESGNVVHVTEGLIVAK